jgi:hypothetical protein
LAATGKIVAVERNGNLMRGKQMQKYSQERGYFEPTI